MTEPVGRLLSVVFECTDPDATARFWEEVLGFRRHVTHPDWATIIDPARRAQRISFQEAPTWPGRERPQQAHIDVLVDDLDRADARIHELGARPLTDHAVVHDDESFRVYADPAGHPFCLIEQVAPDL